MTEGVFAGHLRLAISVWKVTWIVASIGTSFEVDGIMGIDILHQIGGVLDLEQKMLMFTGKMENQGRMISAGVIKPGESSIIQVTPSSHQCLLEPNRKLLDLQPNLLIASIVTNFKVSMIPVVYVGNEEVMITQRDIVGDWKPVVDEDGPTLLLSEIFSQNRMKTLDVPTLYNMPLKLVNMTC